MEEIERHFMDRILGRGIVRARCTADAHVFIDLEFSSSDSDLHNVRLEASPECVDSLAVIGDDLLYRLSRIAISQIQLCTRDKEIVGAQLDLDCAARPWNGDLTQTPYGGATTGCATLT